MSPRRQPDRSERDARQVATQFSDYMGEGLEPVDGEELSCLVEKCLRAYHRRVVKMVKRLDNKLYGNMSDDFQAGNHNAYMHTLAALERLKKATK